MVEISMTDDVACRNTVHELPVGLTSLYIRNIYGSLKRHERNTGKMTFTTASGLLPAGMAVYVQRGRTELVWKYDIRLGCKALRLNAKDACQIDYRQLRKMDVHR